MAINSSTYWLRIIDSTDVPLKKEKRVSVARSSVPRMHLEGAGRTQGDSCFLSELPAWYWWGCGGWGGACGEAGVAAGGASFGG